MSWLQKSQQARAASPDTRSGLSAVLKLFLAFVLAGGLTACSSLLPASPPPAWVMQPPADTPTDLWGVGEGPDIDFATRAALRQIAGRLRVSVSAVTDSSVMVSQQSVYRTDQTRLQEVVRETEFTGVSVSQTSRHSSGVHALVRVDRQAFVRETRARLNEHYSRVRLQLQQAEQADALGRYRALRLAWPDAQQVVSVGQLLRVLDGGGADAQAIAVSASVSQRMAQAASQLTVRIEHASADADVATLLGQWLNQSGFSQVAASSDATLRLQVSSRTESVFDTWNNRLSVNLAWVDSRGNTVAGRAHEINGSSLESAQQARKNAIRRWSQMVKGAEIPATLGLQP